MKYRTIVADPPWEFQWSGGTGGRRRNKTSLGYDTMSIEKLLWLNVSRERADDATLFLWVTQDVLHSGQGEMVAIHWGFPKRVGEFIWRKPNFGTGSFPRCGHETCLIYKRGEGSLRVDRPLNVHSVQDWKQPYDNNGGKRHSGKPDGFYDVVTRGHEGPFLEMFARRQRLGWDTWGDEALNHVELTGRAVK